MFASKYGFILYWLARKVWEDLWQGEVTEDWCSDLCWKWICRGTLCMCQDPMTLAQFITVHISSLDTTWHHRHHIIIIRPILLRYECYEYLWKSMHIYECYVSDIHDAAGRDRIIGSSLRSGLTGFLELHGLVKLMTFCWKMLETCVCWKIVA
jgi:hypothetical protein